MVLDFIRGKRAHHEADELKFLLSFRAGLRAQEISHIQLDSFLTPDGRIGKSIEIRASWTKNRRSRTIPLHPDIKEVLKRFRHRFPNSNHIAVSGRPDLFRHQSPHAVGVWFGRLYREAGLVGCSSHSGRRTFITELARRANKHHASMRDVQILAGHARLDTTERYIEPSEDVSSLVYSLGEKGE